MSEKHSAQLHDPVVSTLAWTTIPLLIGIGSMLLLQVINAYFVSLLGLQPLAALSFTFPVVFVFLSIGLAFSIGIAAVVSKILGEKRREEASRLSTDALVLVSLSAFALVVLGFVFLRPLFSLLGAPKELYPEIYAYMEVWLLGAPLLLFLMSANGALRAVGESRKAGMIMSISALINIILDPIFIFLAGMGIRGAAVASVIARISILPFSLYFLRKHELLAPLRYAHFGESWKQILRISLPALLTNLLSPLALGVATRMYASFGAEVVAAVGVGSRIETLALIGVLALSASLPPFVGQNFGAGNFARVHRGVGSSLLFSLFWGATVALLLGLFAAPISHAFSKDSAVQEWIALYLRLVPFSYGLLGVLMLACSALNALHLPIQATVLSLIRFALLYLPAIYFGLSWFGPGGGFLGGAIANVLIGLFAALWIYTTLCSIRAV